MNNEPFKDLIDERLRELHQAKKVFVSEYDGSSVYLDLRWQTHLEGLFIDQLEKLTHKVTSGEVSAEALGEYVMAFFIAQMDEGKFDTWEEK